MAADFDALRKVRLELEVDGQPLERNEEGILLVRGRPINEVLQTDPEFFAYAKEALSKALEEALGIDPNARPRDATYTRTRDVEWDQLKTLGPDGLLDSDADAKEDKDPPQK